MNIIREIDKQNAYDKLWKIQTNMEKFTIVHIGVRVSPNVIVDGAHIPHTRVAKLVGLHFWYANFLTKQIEHNKGRALGELAQLKKKFSS